MTRSPVHPGEILLEALEERHMSQAEFARRTDLSRKHVNRIINGHALYSTDLAYRFERVLGISAALWINLKSDYQLAVARPGFNPHALSAVIAASLIACSICHNLPV